MAYHMHGVVICILLNLSTLYDSHVIHSFLKSLWAETALHPQGLAQGLAHSGCPGNVCGIG